MSARWALWAGYYKEGTPQKLSGLRQIYIIMRIKHHEMRLNIIALRMIIIKHRQMSSVGVKCWWPYNREEVLTTKQFFLNNLQHMIDEIVNGKIGVVWEGCKTVKTEPAFATVEAQR